MDYPSALAFLDRHVNLEATAGRVHGLSLEAMRRLVATMGDPHQDLRTIHLTGTNGKGSTAAITASLLRALGLRVGTYNSPHVDTARERLAIDGEMIDEQSFGELVGDLAGYAEHHAATFGAPASYFELLTAAALLWFANEAVDVAVVEVGMLGRFDATNVLESEVAVVTNIGRDHTDGVGDWRRAIAGEKAGIVRAGRPLVLGETAIDVRDLFLAEAPEPLYERDQHFGVSSARPAVGGQVLDLFGPHGRYDEVFLPAARALAVAVPNVFPEGAGRRILVLGALGPKEPEEVLEELAALMPDLVVTCTAPSPRAVPADRLAALMGAQGLDVEPVADAVEAVRRAVALADDDDLVLVTGSFYVLSAARQALAEAP